MLPHIAKLINNTEIKNIYISLSTKCNSANYIVECFFIIAGYFLYKTIKNRTSESWFKFVLNKIARLWPVLAFSILCGFILKFIGIAKFNNYTQIINLFFLQCIGITLDFKGINWYVSSYFWVIIFYAYILKNFQQKYSNLTIALCTYFALVASVNHFNGNFARETFDNIFCGGVLRGLFGIGIGYLLATIQENVNKYWNNTKPNKSSFFVTSIIEIYCFIFLLNNFLFHKIRYSNKLIFVLIFAILFYLFTIKQGFLSKLFDRVGLGFCGKYAYSIYVMQQVAFWILSASLWKNQTIMSNIFLGISLSLLFSLAIGIGTFYLIETPGAKKLKEKISKVR